MDKETRDAFDKLDEKITALSDALNMHLIQDASMMQKVVDSTSAAHHRINECEARQEKRRSHAVTLWIGVLLAVVSSALSWIFGGRK